MKRVLLHATMACAAMCIGVGAAQAVNWDDERAARAMVRLDANGDGVLSLEEFRAGAKPRQGHRVDAMFRRIDANGDGSISGWELREEWALANNALRAETFRHDATSQAQIEAKAFDALDADGDGFLTMEEFTAGAAQGRHSAAVREFSRVDRNNDGRISRAEFHEDWSRFRTAMRPEILYEPPIPREVIVLGIERRQPPERIVLRAQPRETRELIVVQPERPAPRRVIVLEPEHREMRSTLDRAFDHLDADNTGRITLHQFRAGASGPQERVDRLFRMLDRDGDGSINRSEFDAGLMPTPADAEPEVRLRIEVQD